MSMAARRQETAVVLPTLWFPVIAGPCGHTTLTSSTLTRTDSRRYGRVIQSQKDVVLLRKIDMENVIFSLRTPLLSAECSVPSTRCLTNTLARRVPPGWTQVRVIGKQQRSRPSRRTGTPVPSRPPRRPCDSPHPTGRCACPSQCRSASDPREQRVWTVTNGNELDACGAYRPKVSHTKLVFFAASFDIPHMDRKAVSFCARKQPPAT